MNPLSYPSLWSLRGFGARGAVLAPNADWCRGPEFAALGQLPTHPYSILWQVYPFGERQARFIPVENSEAWPADATILDGYEILLPDNGPNMNLGGCFDGLGWPVASYEKVNTGQIKVVFHDLTEFTWTGKSPRLVNSGLMASSPANAPVVCFYLDTVGDRILARTQADNFSTVRVVHSGLPFQLAYLTLAERKGNFLLLHALTKGDKRVDVRQVTFVREYAPSPASLADAGKNSVGLVDFIVTDPVSLVTVVESGAAGTSVASMTVDDPTALKERAPLTVGLESFDSFDGVIPTNPAEVASVFTTLLQMEVLDVPTVITVSGAEKASASTTIVTMTIS